MKENKHQKMKRLINKHFPEDDFEEVSAEEERDIEESLGLLKPVTIRLQSYLIDNLKEIADEEGLKYQSLVRSILTKYVRRKKNKAS